MARGASGRALSEVCMGEGLQILIGFGAVVFCVILRLISILTKVETCTF